MIILLWIISCLTLVFGLIMLLPKLMAKVSGGLNKVLFTLDSEDKVRMSFAFVLLLISACAFFLVYYYTR